MRNFFLFIFFLGLVNYSYSQKESKAYKIGQVVNDFKLKNIDGNFQSLEDYKNQKGVIVIFISNSCPYSEFYESRIIALHNKYAPKGFPVVAINATDDKKYPIDSYENMQERAGDKSYPFSYLHDEFQEIAKKFGATHTPQTYILVNQKEGFKIAYNGVIDDYGMSPEYVQIKYVETALDELLDSKTVSNSYTNIVGCEIIWK